MASETSGIAASGIIHSGATTTPIPLSALFTTYNVTISANAFDAEIQTNDGSYVLGPDGTHYGYHQLTPDIPLSQLNQTYFVPSGSSAEATLIAFNADADTNGSSLFSFPAVSVVLGTGVVEGFDYAKGLSSAQIAAIANTGYQFVVRYYSTDGSEIPLSSTELTNLENAGLQICTVFENKTEAGAYTNGTADALAAIKQASSGTGAGQPGHSAIYFVIDDNTSSPSAVSAYFAQVVAVFDNPADNPLGYKVGVYGSGASCAAAVSAGASYSWLNAVSYAWPNTTPSFQSWQIAQIAADENLSKIPFTTLDPNGELPVDAIGNHQIAVGNAIFGVDVDVAKAGVDFGAFGTAAHVAPTVNVQNVSVAANASIAASSLVTSVSNPSNDNVTQYVFYDSGSGGGHFTVNGTVQPSGQYIYVDFSNVANALYVGGSSPGSETLYVAVYDATTNSYSNFSSLTATTTAAHIAPTVSVHDVSVAANASIAASSLVTSVSNPSGDNVDQYVFYDSGSGGGHFTVNGTVQPSGQYIYVDFSNVANALYVGGSSPGSETLYVAVYDATTNSYSNFSSLTATTTQVNIPPTVSLPSGASVAASTAGQVFQFSSLFSGSDPDGDTLTYYLYDGTPAANSGHFVVNGTIVPADTIYQVSAAQLAQTTFVAGASGTSDDLYVEDFDGQAYSGWNAHVNVAVAAAQNHPPMVSLPSGASVAASTAGQVFQFSSLFSGSDPDGDTLTYYLYDGTPAANSGHFVVNGTIVPADTVYQVSAAQLAQTTFVAGAAGTSDDLYVEDFDGQAYSGWNAHVNVAVAAAQNTPPTVSLPSGASVAASTAGEVFQFSTLFSGSDPDGDTLTYYLYDSNAAANSGHFVVNGAIVPADTIYQVTAAQLAQTTFVAGAAGTSDNIYVEAFDSHTYSGWNTYVDVSVAEQNTPPQVSLPSGASVTATSSEVLQFSSLFSGSDPDGDTLTYYLYDGTPASNSGHFVVNGTIVPADTIYQVSAAQLAQTTFVAGASGTSDDLYVEDFDGQAYSGWNAHVNVSVAAQTAPTVNLPSGANVLATAGQSLQASSLFSGSDPDGDTLTYFLYDGTPAANSGHFVVGGNVVPAETIYQVSAAQLAQATFVAGASGTSDDLYVEDYDGHSYSGWNAHVNVSASVASGQNPAPTIILPSGTNVSATAGQTLQASNLFSGSDAGNDTLTYFIYDNTPAANSGHFVVNGTTVPAQTITQVSAAQLALTTVVVGAAGTSDDLSVEAFDGHAYSGWTAFHVLV